MKTALPVADIVDRLGREELTLKHAGGFGEVTGLRHAIVLILRMADEGEESIEPTNGEDS